MSEHCNYWIDCDEPATVRITYKIKRKWIVGYQTEGHAHYLCDKCRKDIQVNLPERAFDFKEELLNEGQASHTT
jgi:transposase-like protein